MLVWAAATAYCCIYCYFFGYIRPDRPLGVEDIHPILGIPSWIFWGVLAPWAVCALISFWFAIFSMADDDLGADHTPELERDIREAGAHS
jgi:hypothetical protein